MKHLTLQQQKVFTIAQNDATLTAGEIATKLGMKETSVRNALSHLKNNELIYPTYVFDLSTVGTFTCAILFSLDTTSSKERDAIHQYLSEHQHTVYFNELGGDYEYVVSIAVSKPADVQEFLLAFSETFGMTFTRKDIAFRVSVHLLGQRYLEGDWKNVEPIQYGSSENSLTIDETDRRLLAALLTHPSHSIAAIGRELKLPASSVSYRHKKLVESNLIKRKIYTLNREKLGVNVYRVLLSLNGNFPELREQLRKLCFSSRNVSILVEAVGSWDFEIQFETSQSSDISDFRELLRKTLSHSLADLKIIPTLKYFRNFQFPIS